MVSAPNPQNKAVNDFEQEEEIHLKDYIRVLMARRWILVSTFIAVVLVGVVWVMMQPPRYKATCTLLIQPEQ